MRTFRDSDISLRPEICPKSVPSIAYRSEFEREALRSDAGPGIQGADRPRLPGRGQATTGVVRRYRLPDGREVRKKIGPAWTGRGRPAAGYFTKRTAEAWLSDLLDQARRGTLPGVVRTGARFADAAAE